MKSQYSDATDSILKALKLPSDDEEEETVVMTVMLKTWKHFWFNITFCF